MPEEIKIQEFGFSEMYEWDMSFEQSICFAKFVTFSKSNPSLIIPYGENATDIVLGISTINSVIDSDNPEEWKYKYITTENGDVVLNKERLAVGAKQYDEHTEMAYIKTYPWEHYVRVTNDEFDESKNYVMRTNRKEWVRVNLLGKAFVYDNGKCEPGKFCTPYVGKIKDNWGKAVPAKETDTNKYYVLGRITDNVILVVNK